MPNVLHLVKSSGPDHPWDILSQRAASNGQTSVVLIQDAVTTTARSPFPTFVLVPDAERRGIRSSYPLIDDEQLLDMILAAETVVVW